jgi:hypothetical protein
MNENIINEINTSNQTQSVNFYNDVMSVGEAAEIPTNQEILQKAWVVFSGETDWPWLRFLRRGFRHCFLVMNDGEGWISMDPLLNRTEVQVYRHLPADFDLPRWLMGRGYVVMPAEMEYAQEKPAPLMLFTCVEAVKRVLGLHAQFVLTPWQLYRHLQKKYLFMQQGDLAWEV